MNRPQYINWFVEENSVKFEDGIPITCYRLNYSIDDEVCCELALHIRQHYETDEELKESLKTTGKSAEEYLKTFIIPQKEDVLGNTSRANDFTEIMISDLLEFIHQYTVPRCKQRNRSGKTQSEHGTDIIAYKFNESSKIPNKNDKLLAVEVKAGLSSDGYSPILNAVSDSYKDETRHSLTLNYYRKKLREIGNNDQANEIARFQQKAEYDYIINYIAAAVISRSEIENGIIANVKGGDLELRSGDNKVFLVHGEKLMDLVHEVYGRCVK